MSQGTSPYRKLPGKARRVSPRRGSLWLAENHLLMIENWSYRESYKRFDLSEIQSLTLCTTRRGTIIKVISGVLLLLTITLFGIICGRTVGEERIAYLTTGIILAFFPLVALVRDLILGPTCRCQLSTAVQSVELHSLSRVKKARRAIAVLEQAITAIQGRLPDDADLVTAHWGSPSPGSLPPPLATPPAAPALAGKRSLPLKLASVLLLAAITLTGVAAMMNGMGQGLFITLCLLSFVEVGVAVALLIRRRATTSWVRVIALAGWVMLAATLKELITKPELQGTKITEFLSDYVGSVCAVAFGIAFIIEFITLLFGRTPRAPSSAAVSAPPPIPAPPH